MPIRLRQIFPVLMAASMGFMAVGCVERRFVVETNVPGAQVSINNRTIGPSPADASWDYTGNYEFRVVAPGYEPLKQVVNVKPRWYEYAPIDFFFEALWPFHIEDVRRYRFDLVPMAPVQTDRLIDAADSLRARAELLPPPETPNPPRGEPANPITR